MRYLTTIPLKLKTSSGLLDLKPGDTFTPKCEDALIKLLAEDKVKPMAEVMGEKYQELTDWLRQHTLTGDEINETLPGLYTDIQDAIERLDTAFFNEDMQAFQGALDRIRLLYAEALLTCGWRIAVKVRSEALQSYLWIVADDMDRQPLRSQGITEAIYTADEIKKLRGMCKDSLKAIHRVKEVFEKSKVEEINKREKERI